MWATCGLNVGHEGLNVGSMWAQCGPGDLNVGQMWAKGRGGMWDEGGPARPHLFWFLFVSFLLPTKKYAQNKCISHQQCLNTIMLWPCVPSKCTWPTFSAH